MPGVEEQLRAYGTDLLAGVAPVSTDAVARAGASDEPRRPKGRWVLAALAAAAVVLLVVLAVRRDGEVQVDTVGPPTSTTSTVPPTIPAAPATDDLTTGPRLLLGPPDWTVERADESDPLNGEMSFTRGGQLVELFWAPAAEFESYVTDRAASAEGPGSAIQVLGNEGILYDNGSGQFDALWQDGRHMFELRGQPFATEDQFRQVAATLQAVADEAWLAALPADVIVPAARAATVAEMLADVPVPPSVDVDSLSRASTATDRYQLGAAVTGEVACGWYQQWRDADPGSDAERQAVEAMGTSPDWTVLRQMTAEGDWPEAVWQVARRMSADNRGEAAVSAQGIGCGPPSPHG